MNDNKRIVWNEGLFIRPQHFQQESRYLESHTNQRIDKSLPFMYGLTEIEFDENTLNSGALVIVRARGVMPDGTCFNIPSDTGPLDPLAANDVRLDNQVVYLALPIRNESVQEVMWPDSHSKGRYAVEHNQVKDIHSREGTLQDIELATLKPRLMLGSEDLSAYSTLPIAKIKGRDENNRLILEENFYPTSLSIAAIPGLKRLLNEASGLMQGRARQLAERIGSPEQAGVADVSDFMLLQALNRMYPEFQHMYSLPSLHPERLYQALTQACGELATFQVESRLPADVPVYNHRELWESFKPLEQLLRQALGSLASPRAVPIVLIDHGHAKWTAPVHDNALIMHSDFVIAVKANMELSQLQMLFMQQAKVGSLEKLNDLVSLQLPGIPFRTLPVAPQQLPYHAGFTYFQMDRSSAEWRDLLAAKSAGFAFHVPGEFSGLEIQFWAIRES